MELSEKLGLSDRQLQMWFCHRRLKDKKELPSKKLRKVPPLVNSTTDELNPKLALEPCNEYGSGSGSGCSPVTRPELRNVVPLRYYESPQTIMELRAIACVEAQLGESLREDGPILGIEFDPLPPDAFGAPLGIASVLKLSYLLSLTCCFRMSCFCVVYFILMLNSALMMYSLSKKQ